MIRLGSPIQVLFLGKKPSMSDDQIPEGTLPSWQDLEDIGAGDGLPTECERCGKPGTPRQQFQHTGVTICYMCADERVDELRSEGSWA